MRREEAGERESGNFGFRARLRVCQREARKGKRRALRRRTRLLRLVQLHARQGKMAVETASAPSQGKLYQGVAKDAFGYKMMAAMGWSEGKACDTDLGAPSRLTTSECCRDFDSRGTEVFAEERRRLCRGWARREPASRSTSPSRSASI